MWVGWGGMPSQVPINITFIAPMQKIIGETAALQVGATLLGCKKGQTDENNPMQSAVAQRVALLSAKPEVKDCQEGQTRASNQAPKDAKHVLT